MTGIAASPAIVVSRMINASAERLFDAWLDPDSIAIWLRPGDAPGTSATIDPRVGGHFTIVMNAASPVIHGGTYRVIDRPRRLVFTWSSRMTDDRETQVTVDFIAQDAAATPAGAAPASATPAGAQSTRTPSSRTEVRITHEQLPHEPARLAHTDGWTDALRLLEQFAAIGVGAGTHSGAATQARARESKNEQ
ncbi:MAG: SRPBCC domain-containing protein [Microbacteriaceae bacterium]